MFPMLLPLLGAGAGALMKKKDPLQGALLGAGLGMGAGALPGLLGGAGAAGAMGTGATLGGGIAGAAPTLAGANAGMGAGLSGLAGAGTASTAAAPLAMPAAEGGAMVMFDKFATQMEPIGRAAQTAGAMQGLLGPQQQQPPMPAPMLGQQGGGDPIAQMLAQQAEIEEQRKRGRTYGRTS